MYPGLTTVTFTLWCEISALRVSKNACKACLDAVYADLKKYIGISLFIDYFK